MFDEFNHQILLNKYCLKKFGPEKSLENVQNDICFFTSLW